jgi:DNA-binding transcriptional regulator LsrR (DeoR family)
VTVNSRGQLLGDGDDDDELLAEVARRYYLDNTSKVDIAKQLDLSRFKVARLLEDARSRGIVQIQIKNPSPIDRSLSELRRRAHLRLA